MCCAAITSTPPLPGAPNNGEFEQSANTQAATDRFENGGGRKPYNASDEEASPTLQGLSNITSPISSLSSVAYSDGQPKPLHADSPDEGSGDTLAAGSTRFKMYAGVGELSVDSGNNLDLLGAIGKSAAPSQPLPDLDDTDDEARSVSGPARGAEAASPGPEPVEHDADALDQLLSVNDSDEDGPAEGGRSSMVGASAEEAPDALPSGLAKHAGAVVRARSPGVVVGEHAEVLHDADASVSHFVSSGGASVDA
jgi:hypothetical protein